MTDSDIRPLHAFLATFLLLTLWLAAGLYAFDPLQLFHRPWWRESVWSGDMRYQAAGILRRERYTGVILGNSLLENTSGAQASALLGGRFINVSVSGSKDREREPLLALAVRQPELKHVIYQINIFDNPGDSLSLSEWEYLYRPGFAKLRFYLKKQYLLCMLQWTAAGCLPDFSHTDLEKIVDWSQVASYRDRFGGLQNWVRNEHVEQMRLVIDSVLDDRAVPSAEEHPGETDRMARELCDTFRTEFMPYAAARPDVRFSLVIPPRFRAFWALRPRQDTDVYLAWHRCIVREAARLPNVRVYGFEDDSYADDVAHYKDLSHYNTDMNARILRAIADGTNMLSEETVEDYIAAVRRRMEAFDADGFRAELRTALEEYRGTER